MEPRTAQPRTVRTARSPNAERHECTSDEAACSGSSAPAIAEIAAMPIGRCERGNASTSGARRALQPPSHKHGSGDVRVHSPARTLPSPGSPGFDVVAHTGDNSAKSAPAVAAFSSSNCEWQDAPSSASGPHARRASATGNDRWPTWAPSQSPAATRSQRSLTSSTPPTARIGLMSSSHTRASCAALISGSRSCTARTPPRKAASTREQIRRSSPVPSVTNSTASASSERLALTANLAFGTTTTSRSRCRTSTRAMLDSCSANGAPACGRSSCRRGRRGT